MKNIVISLSANNDKRRAHIISEFTGKKIPFEFFDAVTPLDNMRLLQKFKLDQIKTNLSEVEVSCFLSHYQIWRYMIEEKIPFVAIFEDDIYLGKSSNLLLTDAKWITHQTHIVKLEKGWQKNIKMSFMSEKVSGKRKLFRLMSPHFGAAGYILSHMGAEYLIKKTEQEEELKPVDVFLFRVLLNDPILNIKQLSPALCIQDFLLNNSYDNFSSSLEDDRKKRLANRQDGSIVRHSIYFKLIREIKRPFLQLKEVIVKILFTRSIDFE